MNLLQSLRQLRDDIKSWVTVNLSALNAKIEKNTIHVDSELNPASSNPVQNKAIVKELRSLSTDISNKTTFSGDYNDLTNAPNITEDESGDMIITDQKDNVIFRVDSEGIHSTALTLKSEPAATEKYVNDKVDIISQKVDNIKIPEVDLSNHYTKEETDAAIDSVKEELSESIVAESSEWTVVDEAGNIIFKVDSEGAHTTSLSLKDGEPAATVTYVNDEITKVNESVNNINDQLDNLNIPNLQGYATEEYVDNAMSEHAEEVLDTHYTKTEIDTIVDNTKESIMSESTEWKVVDEAGNIVFSVDNTGAHTTTLTLDGKTVEEIATDKAKAEVAALVNSAPEALNTLNELANALGDDPNFATTITNEIGKKVDKVEGKDLSTNDFTDAYKQKLDGLNLDNITYEETDPTVPSWAKEPNKPTYTAEEVGLGNVDNTSDADKPISTATQTALDELKEKIMFESQEWHIVDENDNIVFSVDASGAHTTSLTLNNVPVEDIIAEKQDKITGTKGQLVGFDDNGNAIAQDKPTYTADDVGALSKDVTLADLDSDNEHRTVTDEQIAEWNDKSEFSGSYKDLSDVPADLATQEFVTTKINEAQLAGGEVDLSVYYTKSEVDTAITNAGHATQADVDNIKADAVFKILGSDPNSFAIEVNASDNKTIIQALGEAGAGLYTLYVQKGVSDNPTGSESSCRGICCVNTWYNTKEYYAWMILFDSDGNAYSRYMSAYGASEWQKITPDLGTFYTKTEIDELIPDWALATEKPAYTAYEVGALSKDTTLANLTDDENHRTVSDIEKDAWNNKSDFSGKYEDLTGIPDPVDLSKYALNETVEANKKLADDHAANEDIHVTATDKENWNNKSSFSGSYNDLTDVPDAVDLTPYATTEFVTQKIAEAELGEGNVDLSAYYTKTEVDTAIANIEHPTVDLSGYASKTDFDTNKVATDAHLENTVIHVTEDDKITWNAKSNFSGDYNDLTNAPNITEDESNNLVITDPNGNIIFRSDGNGFETTTLTAQSITLNGINVEENLNAINTLLNVTDADNGKVLMVVDGRLQLTTINN